MNFIKKVFDKKIDNSVHVQFQKFGRGEFRNRALINAKNVKGRYTISTTTEFANELVKLVAERLGDGETKVTGAIISTSNLKGELEFKEIKQFQGVKRYMIDSKMSGNEIISLLDKFPRVFFALSFDSGKGDILKIKAKAPKSAKPKNKEEKPKPDFCKLITNDKKISHDFVFEKLDFKSAEISHDFIIEKIVIPDELKNKKDFAVVRERALRKGKIIRRAVIDGKEMKSEMKFEA